MRQFSTQKELGLIGVGYGIVLGGSALAAYQRYAWKQAHPDIVVASSGMYAAGDMMLAMFASALLLIPTFFLVRLLSRMERPAMLYARILLASALTAPVALAIFRLSGSVAIEAFGALSFMRLWWSPFVLAVIIASRLLAKFPASRRLLNYALLAEAGTLATSLALIAVAMSSHNH